MTPSRNHVEFTAVMQIFVDGIPAGINNPIEQHHVADLQLPDVRLT